MVEEMEVLQKEENERLFYAYCDWCQNNRCSKKDCHSNKHGICEDIRGVVGCKSRDWGVMKGYKGGI